MASLPFYPPSSRALTGLNIPRNRPSSSHKSPTDCTSPGSDSGSSWRKQSSGNKSGKHRQQASVSSIPGEQGSTNNSGTATPETMPDEKAGHNGSLGVAMSMQQGEGRVYSVSTSSSGTSSSFMSSLPSSSGSKHLGGRSTDTDVNNKGTTTPPSPSAKQKPAASPISRTASSSNIFSKRKPSSAADSPRRPSTASTSRSFSSTAPHAAAGGRLGSRLPQGLYFDALRANEVSAAHKLELDTYDPRDDAASFDAFKYRMNNAPHLFFGAFLPLPPPKVSGPLSMSGPRPRKLIGYVCGTAASAYTARSFKFHQDDEDAWLVCVHSVVVAKEHQRRGLALKLMEEYMKRLRRAEEGIGSKDNVQKHGYECVAVLAHENMVPLFEKASFKRFRVSHVTSGTGEWIEMRRKIASADDDEVEDDGECAVLSPASCESSGFLPPRTPPSATTATFARESATPTIVEKKAADSTSPPKKPTAWMGELGKQSTSPTELSPKQGQRETDVSQTTIKPAVDDERKDGSMAASVASVADAPAPAPFSQAQLLAALQSQSKANKENTGIAYSTLMGQTLASKTSVEDAFYALEARLVNREDMTNLADLICPREGCGCVILREGTSDWDMVELGPLASGETGLPNNEATSGASAIPPSVAPPLKKIQRIRNVFGAPTPTTEAKVGTPPRPFWIVQSPMIFDNIGFSRDVEWAPPPPRRSSSDGSDEKKGTNSEGAKSMRRRLTGGSSTFFKNVGKRDRGASESTSPTSPLGSVLGKITRSHVPSAESSAPSSHQGETRQTRADSGSSEQAQLKVSIKYLMCAECDFGPLGYTVLPNSLQGGQFAAEIGKETQEQQQGAGAAGGAGKATSSSNESSRAGSGSGSGSQQNAGGGSSSPTLNVVQQAAQAKPFYYVAADRVRYRFPKKEMA